MQVKTHFFVHNTVAMNYTKIAPIISRKEEIQAELINMCVFCYNGLTSGSV